MFMIAFLALTQFVKADSTVCNQGNYVGFYNFYCRGRLTYQLDGELNVPPTQIPNGGSVTFGFTRSNTAAGSKGENLTPGTCAWEDRGVLPSEPNRVAMSFSMDSFLGLIAQEARTCAKDANCVFSTCAKAVPQSPAIGTIGWTLKVFNR